MCGEEHDMIQMCGEEHDVIQMCINLFQLFEYSCQDVTISYSQTVLSSHALTCKGDLPLLVEITPRGIPLVLH